jgi:hypothetical protein
VAQREEMHFQGVNGSLDDDECFVFAIGSNTNQLSFEPLDSLAHEYKGETMNVFTAKSLGRRVVGYYSIQPGGEPDGGIDFVLPLQVGEVEKV